MANNSTASVDAVVSDLRAQDDVSLVDIVSLAESSVEQLRSILQNLDSSIYREFRGIAEQIEKAKADINDIGTGDIKNQHIPTAGQELSAIVEATEEATDKIMEAAETIMTADASDPATYHSIVNDNVMGIFEACSFQDLTGQRISKVVETLDRIDRRVTKFMDAINGSKVADVKSEIEEEEAARDQRSKDLLLNGPALDGPEVAQDDIDNLFE